MNDTYYNTDKGLKSYPVTLNPLKTKSEVLSTSLIIHL
jgi:hypothetical protein